MIEIIMRQMPAEIVPQYRITVNGHEAGYVHRHPEHDEQSEHGARWCVTGRETVYVSKEAAACMVATRWFEQNARTRSKKQRSGPKGAEKGD